MERLTKHSKQTSHENGICCTHFREPECLGVGGNCAMNCKWEEAAWSRLAAYEDAGLTPSDVHSLWGEWNAMMSALNSIGGGYERLRQLAEADKDGRVVVLPCKAGSTVYRIYDDCDLPGDCYTAKMCKGCEYRNLFIEEQAFCLSMLSQNGMLGHPYYLTREEAEEALEAMKK